MNGYVLSLPIPGPVHVRCGSSLIDGGRVDETCRIHDSSGRLVAQGSQLSGYSPTTDHQLPKIFPKYPKRTAPNGHQPSPTGSEAWSRLRPHFAHFDAVLQICSRYTSVGASGVITKDHRKIHKRSLARLVCAGQSTSRDDGI
jgi:Acyl-CoA thioesterase C-terminal domain